MDSIEKIEEDNKHYHINFKKNFIDLKFIEPKIPDVKVLEDMEKNKIIPAGFPVELEYSDGSKFEVEFAKDNKISDVFSFKFGKDGPEYKKVGLDSGGYHWKDEDGKILNGSDNPAEPFIIENEKFWIYPKTFTAGKGNFIDNEGKLEDGTKAIFVYNSGIKQEGTFNEAKYIKNGKQIDSSDEFKKYTFYGDNEIFRKEFRLKDSDKLLFSTYHGGLRETNEPGNQWKEAAGYPFKINGKDCTIVIDYDILNNALNKGSIKSYGDLAKSKALEIYEGEIEKLYDNNTNKKLDDDEISSISNNNLNDSIKYCLSECSKQIFDKKIPNRDKTKGLDSGYGELTKFLILSNTDNVEQLNSLRFPNSDIEKTYSSPGEFFDNIGIAIDKLNSISNKYLVLPLEVPGHAVTGAIDLEIIKKNIETAKDPEKIKEDPKIFENALVIFDSSRYITTKLGDKNKRTELGLGKNKAILDYAKYPNKDIQKMGTCWLHSAISSLSMAKNEELVKKNMGNKNKEPVKKVPKKITKESLKKSAKKSLIGSLVDTDTKIQLHMTLEQQSLVLKYILELDKFAINNGIEKVGLHNDRLKHKNKNTYLARQIIEPEIISSVIGDATKLQKELSNRIAELEEKQEELREELEKKPGFLKATEALDIFIKNDLDSPEKIKKSNLAKIKKVSEKLSEAFEEHDRKKGKALGE